MRERCNNPTHMSYKNYGGRGVAICERWDKFENFFADMGERPSPKHSLDRIDNDGNYEPNNCRWATRSQQNGNRQHTKRFAWAGQQMAPVEIYRDSKPNISFRAFLYRLSRGRPVEQALNNRQWQRWGYKYGTQVKRQS